MPSSNFPNGFSGGLSVKGLNVLNTYGGQVFWVDTAARGGADTGKGTFERPFNTITYALTKCTANRGDIILLKPGFTQTKATVTTLDVAGVAIVGLGSGSWKPTFTTSGTVDCFNVTATGVTLCNLAFAAPGIDAVTADINIGASFCQVIDTRHIGSATSVNKVDIITIAAAGSDSRIDGARIFNSTVEVVGGIVFEGACSRVEVCNCAVLCSTGFTDGCISDEAQAFLLYIHDNVFQNVKTATVVMSFGSNSLGVCSNNYVCGRHSTLASNVDPGTSMNFFNNYVVEQAAVNGVLIPAADVD